MNESSAESGNPADCKNQPRLAIRLLPNALTALRLPLTMFVLWLLYSGLKGLTVRINPILYFLFALICLSDFFDGKIARYLGVQSRAGAILDVSADCFFIFSSLFTLNLFGLMPIWYTLLVIADFAVFIPTSRLLKQKIKGPGSFVFDSLGRAAACLFYIMPVLCCLTISLPQFGLMFEPMLYLNGLIAIISVANRCAGCIPESPRFQKRSKESKKASTQQTETV